MSIVTSESFNTDLFYSIDETDRLQSFRKSKLEKIKKYLEYIWGNVFYLKFKGIQNLKIIDLEDG